MVLDPQSVLKQCGFVAGMKVADFGAGVGHWSLLVAPMIGSGVVHAIDIQKDLLGTLAAQARERHLHNVEVLWSDVDEPEGVDLRGASMDAVLMCNALFQFEKRDVALREAYRVLRKNGFLVLVDWSDSFGGMGPQPDMVVSQELASRLCEREGFVAVKTLKVGAHHWGILMRKP